MNTLKPRLIRLFNKVSNKIYDIRYPNHGQNIPDIKKLEIEITSQCNLLCNNCNRNCFQAPRNEIFSVNQMKKFVNESLLLHWQWKYIWLIGGEPTLHPNFMELISILGKYKKVYPQCIVEIATNGFGPQVKSTLAKIPNWVSVKNSHKKGRIHLFEKYNQAPIDKKANFNLSFKKGCWVTGTCGLGLNRFGYYPCGPGAAVDRIFGFNIGTKHLEEVSLFKMTKSLKQLCRYCGHFPTTDKNNLSKKQSYSLSWKKAFNSYQNNPNQLTTY